MEGHGRRPATGMEGRVHRPATAAEDHAHRLGTAVEGLGPLRVVGAEIGQDLRTATTDRALLATREPHDQILEDC